MIITCPRCFRADEVSYEPAVDGGYLYTCAWSSAHVDGRPHWWAASPRDPEAGGGWSADGVTDELLDPLLNCVGPGEPFVEYGIVEYRLRQRYPELFAAHVRERGHVALGPIQATASSVRFAAALGRLAGQGLLERRYGPATGCWRHNQTVSYWARCPVPEVAGMRTWAQFCADLGRPDGWTQADRVGLTSLRQGITVPVVAAAEAAPQQARGGRR